MKLMGFEESGKMIGGMNEKRVSKRDEEPSKGDKRTADAVMEKMNDSLFSYPSPGFTCPLSPVIGSLSQSHSLSSLFFLSLQLP